MFTRRGFLGAATIIASAAFRARAETAAVETIVVPFAVGGPADLTARALSPVLSKELKRTIVIVNRAGAGGITGLSTVSTAKADAHVLGFATVGAMAMAPHLMTMPFDPLRDVAFIGLIGKVSELLVISTHLPVRNFSEFVAYARKHPGKVTIASTGSGGIAHLAIELLKSKASIDVVHVPYRGAAPALVDVLSGQVDAVIADVSNFIGQSNSDRLLPLLVASSKRSPVMPEVPTAAEAGLSGYEVENWYAFIAPKETSSEELATLNRALNASLRDESVIRAFEKVGIVPLGGTATELRDYEQAEYARWGEVIHAAGIQIN